MINLRSKSKGLPQRTETQQPQTPQQPPQGDTDVNMEPDNGARPPPTPQVPNVETFSAVIEAAVARSIAAFQATRPHSTQRARSSKRKNQMPKEGSVAHSRQIKKAAFDALDEKAEKDWKVYCHLII